MFKSRIDNWVVLGDKISAFLNHIDDPQNPWEEKLQVVVNRAVHHNGWFEKDQVLFALKSWSEALQEDSLTTWTSKYDASFFNPKSPKKVGIVMAGNIPLVGLHDLLSISISGHDAVVKMSGDDNQLLPALLSDSDAISANISWVEQLKGVDAIIATGSDNTARYFEHYFEKYPNIIRKNRKSVAVLSGDETEGDLTRLGEDVFRYFGMGCRNVSKLYLPESFDLDRIFGAWMPFSDVINNHKYVNNYDYHRAILLLDRKPFLENGFVIVREHESFSSPVGMVHYERYTDLEKVRGALVEQRDSIQCVVGTPGWHELPMVEFGDSQSPKLWDYADGVDTLAFLSALE